MLTKEEAFWTGFCETCKEYKLNAPVICGMEPLGGKHCPESESVDLMGRWEGRGKRRWLVGFSYFAPPHVRSLKGRLHWEMGRPRKHEDGRFYVRYRGKTIPRARAVWMICHPGEQISYDEVIHHLNGDKTCDKPDNLVKWLATDHTAYHNKNRRMSSVA